MLLSLYETKIHMLENPKKKSKMWTTIAEELKSLNIEVSSLTASIYYWMENAQITFGYVSFNYFYR